MGYIDWEHSAADDPSSARLSPWFCCHFACLEVGCFVSELVTTSKQAVRENGVCHYYYALHHLDVFKDDCVTLKAFWGRHRVTTVFVLSSACDVTILSGDETSTPIDTWVWHHRIAYISNLKDTASRYSVHLWSPRMTTTRRINASRRLRFRS